MLTERVLPHRVTVRSPQVGATDEWGIASEGVATEVLEVPAWVERRTDDEQHDAEGDRLVEEWRMLTNHPLAASDTVEWEGITFTVEGPPAPATSLRGHSHYEAVLRRVQEV